MKPLAEVGLALIMLGGCRMAAAPAAPQGYASAGSPTSAAGGVVSATGQPVPVALPPAAPVTPPVEAVVASNPPPQLPVAEPASPMSPPPPPPAVSLPAAHSASPAAAGTTAIPWPIPAPSAPPVQSVALPPRLPELPPPSGAPGSLPGSPAVGGTSATTAEVPPKPDWSFLKTETPEPAKPDHAPILPRRVSQAAAPAASDRMPSMVAPPAPQAPGAGSRPVTGWPLPAAAESYSKVALPAPPPPPPSAPAAASQPVPPPTAAVGSGPAPSDIRLVNSKRISFNYEVKNVGSSGVTAVELWCTRDGRSWKKLKTFEQARPPCVIEVEEEDLYGFTLVVRSGVGLGKQPQEGDKPQVWVEVDTTRPVVRLMGVEAGQGNQGRSLTIRWKATDKNLGPRPITLLYATEAAGPWKPIVAQLANTGHYVWQIPSDVPHHLLVRVEAVDLVGNLGMAQTTNPLLDDLSQPTASILTVEGKGK